MNIKQLTRASNSTETPLKSTTLTNLLAVGSLALGLSAVAYAAPAHAIALTNSSITFTNSSLPTFFADVNPGALDTITVSFVSPLDVGSSSGLLAGGSFFPSAGMYAISPIPTATFNYIAGNDSFFTYSLASNLNIDFTNGATVTIAGGTQFNGSKNASGTSFSTIDPTGSSFKNGTDVVPLNALSFGFNDIVGRGTGGLVLTASSGSPQTTQVPEPFTIVGTIIGGTAALRMRKKLAKAAQN
jgi:hypothetical protein